MQRIQSQINPNSDDYKVYYQHNFEWDFDAAEKNYLKALEVYGRLEAPPITMLVGLLRNYSKLLEET